MEANHSRRASDYLLPNLNPRNPSRNWPALFDFLVGDEGEEIIESKFEMNIENEVKTEKCLVFENPGVLDLEVVKLMGVSVKETDNPIGMFGTGLKFSIATALRFGGSVEIILDGTPNKISTRSTVIRGKEFHQVTLNDEPLGFTTDLGKNWEPWMCIRELLSNARDEGGISYESENPESWKNGTTILLYGEKFLKVWQDKERYFMEQNSPLVQSKYCDIHPKSGWSSVYYKSIMVHQLESTALYSYNITADTTLTEDRTLQYPFQLRDAICRAVVTCENEDVITNILAPSIDYWEKQLDFDIDQPPSAMFKKVCSRMARQKPKNFNMRALSYYRKQTGDSPDLEDATITPLQSKVLEKAKNFVMALGYEQELEKMPIRVVVWLGEGVFGRADKGTIFLAKPIFDLGTKYVASTLLEEFVHNRTGHKDCTREMQTWLFDKIISIGEEMSGEPL